jgi:hypothetical protein
MCCMPYWITLICTINTLIKNKIIFLKIPNQPVIVVHTCNPSCEEGRDRIVIMIA